MKKVKNILLALVIIITHLSIYSQEEYQQQLDNIFEIPTAKMPSGILINRSPVLIDYTRYSSSNQMPDTCDMTKWLSIYYMIYVSHLQLDA